MRQQARAALYGPVMTRVVRWITGLVICFVAPCAYAGATLTLVDSRGVGSYNSLHLNAGNPVISYYELPSTLKLATCTANCQSATPTWVINSVDHPSDVRATSLQLDGSKPVIASFDWGNNLDLKLATCTANCQSAAPTWVVTIIDGAGNSGMGSSLQLNGGNPVISYGYYVTTARDTEELRLATCTANCQSATPTWVIATVDVDGSGGGFGHGTSLQLNAGKPVVAYLDNVNFDLKLATCTANCQSATPTWVTTTVDGRGTAGYAPSLQLNGGNPVISYGAYVTGAEELRLATCTANCQSATPTWIITTVAGGRNSSLQIDDGKPVISYYDVVDSNLKLATCTANCQTPTPTWLKRTVDSTDLAGQDNSLQLNGRNAIISYYDHKNVNLKLATITPPTVASITRAGASPTAAPGVIFTVTFSESVTGVDATDFVLSTTGLTGASIVGASGAGTTWNVIVSTGTGNGTLRLDLIDDDSIAGVIPLGGLGIGNGSFTTGESYTVEKPALFGGTSATGSGTIAASFTGGGNACIFSAARFIGAPPGAPPMPPSGPPGDVLFLHGLFDFSAAGCTPGSTLTFTIKYPSSIAGATYWKYGPTSDDRAPHWYVLPATVTGDTATFTITDGGLGDDDLVANGTIVDQGGPGLPSPEQKPIPTLSEWGQMLLALFLLAAGASAISKRSRARR